MARLIFLIGLLLLLVGRAEALPPVYLGEDTGLSCTCPSPHANGFCAEKIGSRWIFCAPDGHPFWPAGPEIFNTSSGGARQTMLPYTKVYIVPNAGSGVDVTTAARDTNGNDVVTAGHTLSAVGDTLILGGQQPPNFVYFQMGTTGVLAGSTAVTWEYWANATTSWKPINGTGVPRAVNAAGGATFSGAGSTYGSLPSNAAVLTFGAAGSNWMTLFNYQTSVPAAPSDFTKAAITVSGQSPPALYYVRARVTGANYTTPPVLNQITEEPDALVDQLEAKYGVDLNSNWANDYTTFLLAHGMNSTGDYSNIMWSFTDPNRGCTTTTLGCNASSRAKLTHPMPLFYVMNPDFTVTGNRGGAATTTALGITSYIKDIARNSSTYSCRQQRIPQADASDPQYVTALEGDMECEEWNVGPLKNGCGFTAFEAPSDLYYYGMVPDETDYTGGFSKQYSHDNVGLLVAENNPHETAGDTGITFSDVYVYSKFRLAEFLGTKYGCPADTSPDSNDPLIGTVNILTGNTITACSGASDNAAPTATALAARNALNTAWGTSYTTFGTSSGSVTAGTNAFATGTGFMDENGSHLVANCGLDNDYAAPTAWSNNATIGNDILAYDLVMNQEWARKVKTAIDFIQSNYLTPLTDASGRPYTLPPRIMEFVDPPDFAVQGTAPYVDGFKYELGGNGVSNTCSATPYTQACVQNTFARYIAATRAGVGHGLPTLIENFSSGSADSAIGFYQTITSSVVSGGNTIVSFTGVYPYHGPVYLHFPDSPSCGAFTLVSAATWAGTAVTVTVPGDFSNATGCLATGTQHVMGFDGFGAALGYEAENTTRVAMGTQMYNQINWILNTADSGGEYDLAGWAKWAVHDDWGINTVGPGTSWSMFSTGADAYDGSQACSTGTVDSSGFPVGGELINNVLDTTCFGDEFGSCASGQTTLCGLLDSGGAFIYPNLLGLGVASTTGIGTQWIF